MKPKKSLSEKVHKEMPEFADAVAGLSVEELDARLAQIAKDIEAVQESKEADEKLEQARAVAAEAAAPYSDSKKALKLKTSYIIGLIKEKGGV